MPDLTISNVFRSDPDFFPTSMEKYSDCLANLNAKFVNFIFDDYFNYFDHERASIIEEAVTELDCEGVEWRCVCNEESSEVYPCKYCALKDRVWDKIEAECRNDSDGIAVVATRDNRVFFRLQNI